MRNIKKIVLLVIVAPIIFLACKKNVQDKTYKDIDRISIGGLKSENPVGDSVIFTFATLPLNTNTYNLTLVAKIAGQLSNLDRQFNIQIVPERTTADASEYSLPSTFVIKANDTIARIPITVKRSDRIKDRSVRLSLRVVANENFDLVGKSIFNYVWTDDVVQPVGWSVAYWGKYSKVKHRFFLVNTDYPDLSKITNPTVIGAVFHAASQALDALNAYNAANPGKPLLNESNLPIDICNNCN